MTKVRIPFPVRIPLWGATAFAAVLFAVQLWQGTGILFSICCFLFIVIAVIAFNVAGGFSYPSGAYVFFYATLSVVVGLCWKAIIGEPADTNLLVPLLTIQVFLGGITAMLAAVYISRRLTPRRALLQGLITDANMQNATVGCLVTGLAVTVVLSVFPGGNGSVLSALAQINRFLPMAIILGVIHQIRKSGGTSSINLPVLVAGAAVFIGGLLGFSKEGMFEPILCWFVSAASQRYKLSLYQIFGGGAALVFMILFLVPYSQYGRNLVPEGASMMDRVNLSIDLLTSLGAVRDKFVTTEVESFSEEHQSYFNKPQGFLERLQMVSVDDGLIEVTERKGVFGYAPITAGFLNLVPHVFWPSKPSIGFGNLYAHEIGGLPEDDFTTGISFSPSGEAYHIAKWTGIFILAPALWIMLFTLFNSLCGDTRVSPWGLLMVAYFAHMAPEGMLGGVIYTSGFGTFGLLVAALSATYVMPIIGTLFKGPEKTRLRRTAFMRIAPRRAAPISSSPDSAR